MGDARATRDPRPEEGFFRVVFHRDTPLIRSTPDPDRIPRLGPAARRPRRASPSPRTDANRTHRIRSVPRRRAPRRPPVARVRIPRNESDALFCFDSGGPGTRKDDAKSTTVSKRVARVRRAQTAISKSREIHRIRSDPSPSRTSVASSSTVASIHPSIAKKIVERESNPHLRLAKQPAGGPTEDRARGVRVELGRRPRCLFRRRGRCFLFGAHDDGGPAGGRSTGRRPRGRPHRAGLSSREAEHFRRALLRGVPTGTTGPGEGRVRSSRGSDRSFFF